MDENTAISRARQLLARYEIKISPVDVLRIADLIRPDPQS